MKARLALLAAILLTTSACHDDICIDRGKVTGYDGSYTFTTSSGGAAFGGVSGTATSQLLIDDFDPYENGSCDTDNAEFTVHLGTCKLYAYATTAEHDTGGKYASGDFLSASADLEADQVCTLSLDGTVGQVKVSSGSLVLTPGNAVLNVTGGMLATDAFPSFGTITIVYHGSQ
jgi:hypothetical protein